MKNVLEWLAKNWFFIAPVIYELLVRVIPTKWNVSILDNFMKLLNAIITNKRIPDPDDKPAKEPGKNLVPVDTKKHIIK